MVKTRKSSSIGVCREEGLVLGGQQPNTNTAPGGNFNTRFSLPSYVRRLNELSDSQKIAIERMGFGNLLRIPCHMLSKNLLAELMDRWCCENRAFLLVPGNITLTLMDVALVLGLRVTGDPVVVREDDPFSDLEKEYGATALNRKITIASIEERLDSVGDIVNEDFIRLFLLFTFGTILFPAACGKVNSRYLNFLQDLDKVCNFAWGAAVLEDITNWLCKRKEMNVQYVGGCLIFLQIWSYEHIDIARPSLLDSGATFPRVCRWENSRSHQRQWFSRKFKELEKDQITWKLQLTCNESKSDIIKELLEVQINANEFPLRSSSDMINEVHKSDMGIVTAIQGNGGECSTKLRRASVKNTEYVDLTTSHRSSEGHRRQIEQPSISQCGPVSAIMVSEDDKEENDVGRNGQSIYEENIQLKKEIIELRKENSILKESRSTSEEQNRKLRNEVDDLRQENECILSSSSGLVARLERLILDEEINANEEQSAGPLRLVK